MSIEVNGKIVDTTETGFLVNIDDWTPDVAQELAKSDSLVLTEKHWDFVNYLRDEYLNNAGNQPNNRAILKDMGKRWGCDVTSKAMYDLFPGNPSKQGGRIGGIPESKRKGGY